MIAAGYLCLLCMGIVLGMVGGGGSILTVPILVYLFEIDVILATGYSLFVVGLTALMGGMVYFRRGQVDVAAGIIFAVPSFVGVYLSRSYLLPSLPDPVFSSDYIIITKSVLIMGVFAILMIFASFSMIKNKRQHIANVKPRPGVAKCLLISGEGFVVGVVTGFVGAGGGFLIIPALIVLVGLPIKTAVGTSLLIIAVNSFVGFTGDLQHQGELMDWILLFRITGLAIVGLFLGLWLSRFVVEQKLKMVFGYFVLTMGVVILASQILS